MAADRLAATLMIRSGYGIDLVRVSGIDPRRGQMISIAFGTHCSWIFGQAKGRSVVECGQAAARGLK
jgi:hypothetical protein